MPSRARTCLPACCNLLLAACFLALGAPAHAGDDGSGLPRAIRAIMAKPNYSEATWGLRVVDADTGDVIYDLNSGDKLLTGSVRKLYSVGTALNQLGSDDRFVTPVYRNGKVTSSGELKGDLILVAKGDLTMGGRDTGHDTVAVTNFDHCDANGLGGAILTKPDPLAGLNKLAAQVASSGIRKISGDVIIDDRFFQAHRVPNQDLLIVPIVINDNRIDVTISPTKPGEQADLEWRPQTAAFHVRNEVTTVADGEEAGIRLTQINDHEGVVTGTIVEHYTSPLTGGNTLVQTFRTDFRPEEEAENPNAGPDAGSAVAFARTTFIEALERAGITVEAPVLGPNPARKLPPRDSYEAGAQVAALVSAPYSQYAKLILKVSHNLGANMSLMLFGLTQDVRTMPKALVVERNTLTGKYGLDGDGFSFPTNGSGSPDSAASAETTVDLLLAMKQQPTFPSYFQSLPILGVDGSLATIGTASPARGKVFAKTGTYLAENQIKAQSLAGFIHARSGRHLAYALFVNNAGTITGLEDVIRVIEDEAEISTIIQQRN